MKNIQTEIIINSPVSKVWNTLMDFEKYADWNPFVQIKGEAKKGAQLENTMNIEGQKPQTFKPTILECKSEEEFRWEGHLFVKGLFDGEHYFLLESISENKTKIIHGENFRGILSNMILNMIGEKTKAGFIKMNEALKDRCETSVEVSTTSV